MQPLYPYFAIYRGPKKTEELKKYIYSHAQALTEIGELSDNLKAKVKQTTLDCNNIINENAALISHAKSVINAYIKGSERF